MLNFSLWWPVFLIVIAVVWGLGRIVYLHRFDGVQVLSFVSRKRTLNEKLLALVAIVLDAYLILRPVYPSLDHVVYAGAFIHPLWGLNVMTIGIALVIISQAQMGRAWRIGVPPKPEEGQMLVQSGLFRLSRNPIYLGIMVFLLGALLLAPGPLTLLTFMLCGWFINSLIRSEEMFMQATFGRAYTDYCNKVRRWV